MIKTTIFLFSWIILVVESFAQAPGMIEEVSDLDFSNISKIGIYVNPTKNNLKDLLVYNLTSLHCISLGYSVHNLNAVLEAAGRGKKRNFKKNVEYIYSNCSEESRNFDILLAIETEWKELHKTVGVTSLSEYYYKIPSMKMKVSLFKPFSKKAVLTRESTDTTKFYSGGEDRILATPARYMVMNNLSKTIGLLPPCYQNDTLIAGYRIPVLFYVDQRYRYYYSRDWKQMLERRLIVVNDLFKTQFDIEFYVEGYRTWNTDTQESLALLINQLVYDSHQARTAKNCLVIGITHDQLLSFTWFDRNVIGMGLDVYNCAVVKDLPTTVELRAWDSLDEAVTLAHELGHVLGAIHILDPRSIMYPTVEMMGFEFDEYNKAIMNFNKDRLFDPKCIGEFRNYVIKLNEIQETYKLKNTYYAGTLGSIASQFIAMEHPVDSLSFIFSDSSEYLVARGFLSMNEENFEEALEYFLRATELNPEFSSLYFQIHHLYQQLGDEKKAEKYLEKAKKFGFKDTKTD